MVEVAYDPSRISPQTLVEKAGQLDFRLTSRPPARNAKPSDRKFALRRTELRYLPLTPMQATKVNADLRLGREATRWLSPRQMEILTAIRSALKDDAGVLTALKPADSLEGLTAYQDKLTARLDR